MRWESVGKVITWDMTIIQYQPKYSPADVTIESRRKRTPRTEPRACPVFVVRFGDGYEAEYKTLTEAKAAAEKRVKSKEEAKK